MRMSGKVGEVALNGAPLLDRDLLGERLGDAVEHGALDLILGPLGLMI
jgi:hypothetical protein